MEANWVISFGPFRVIRARRQVERSGEAIRLGSRAFDVLVYLLEHAGQVVSHRALLEAVWPGIYVEEGNLRFQMASLRKALGNGEANYIINVPGRGYCFTAALSKQDEAEPPPPAAPAGKDGLAAANILPYPASQLLMEKINGTVNSTASDRERKYEAEVYTKLDDLTLGVELVVSQIKAFGIEKLSDMLEARWLPGPPQQSTLYAMLDWSYRLLPEKEKSVFRHLSVFSGRFDLEAASAIVDEDVETASALTELVSRALLSRNQSEFGTRYRLLDTTRRYARDRLTEANEMHEARRRHAMFFMRMLQNLKDGDFDQNLPKMLASEVDDVLAAVTWLFKPAQDSLSCRRALEEATYFEQFMMKSCMG